MLAASKRRKTTTMVTTITTASTTTAVAAASLALITILTLLALLIQKEIISGLGGARAANLSRALNIALVPLIVVFAITVAFRVLDVLR
jgi:hypothetical protein